MSRGPTHDARPPTLDAFYKWKLKPLTIILAVCALVTRFVGQKAEAVHPLITLVVRRPSIYVQNGLVGLTSVNSPAQELSGQEPGST